MIKNKKLTTAFLLITVYALLMFQETILHLVWCYKENGPAALEVAVFDLQCGCSQRCQSHQYHEYHEFLMPYQRSSLLCVPGNCIDQPFDSPWLVRDISPNRPDINLSQHFTLTGPMDAYLTIPPDRFLRTVPLIPLTKFPPKPSSPHDSISLRC